MSAPSQARPTFSLVLPLYNEAATIPHLCEALTELLRRGVEVVLVDNASTDETAEVAARCVPGAQVVSLPAPNRGFGGGVKAGLQHCTAQTVGWMPANGKVDPLDAYDFLQRSHAHNAVVKGHRRGRRPSERVKTALVGAAQSAALGEWVTDTGGTPTAVPASFLSALLDGPDDYSFETYTLVLAKRSGVKVLRPDASYGTRAVGASHWQRGLRSEISLAVRLVRYCASLRR